MKAIKASSRYRRGEPEDIRLAAADCGRFEKRDRGWAHRYYTAKQFRRTTAPVVTIPNEFTSWNPTLLRAEFDELPPIGDLDLAVFDFAVLIPWEPAAGATDPDEVPPVRRTDITPGDLFALCAHRCRRSAAGRSCGSPQFQAQPVRRRGPV